MNLTYLPKPSPWYDCLSPDSKDAFSLLSVVVKLDGDLESREKVLVDGPAERNPVVVEDRLASRVGSSTSVDAMKKNTTYTLYQSSTETSRHRTLE